MRTKMRRLALLGMLMGGLLGTGLAPANAAGTTQISGFGTTTPPVVSAARRRRSSLTIRG